MSISELQRYNKADIEIMEVKLIYKSQGLLLYYGVDFKKYYNLHYRNYFMGTLCYAAKIPRRALFTTQRNEDR